jgi:hypothetical protein
VKFSDQITDVEMSSPIQSSDPCVLIEGPSWGNAEFYGKWLLAAAQAETFWKEALKDPDFEKQVERVSVVYMPDFGIAASMMLIQLEEHRTTFVLDLHSEDGDDFAMMITMGFFAPYCGRYRMTIPFNLSVTKVKAAVLKYAQTEDKEYVLHPEYLVNTMSFSEARAWQNRLSALDQFCKDSNVLGRA